MLKLINNQHFIDLSSFLNIEKLDSLHDKISYAIGKSAEHIYPASPPAYSFAEPTLVSHLQLKEELKKNHPELNNFQLDWFALMNGCGSHGFCLFLRNISHYPGDFKNKFLSSYTSLTPAGHNFNFLFDWIEEQQCFKEYGRVLFFISPAGSEGIIHRDNKGLDEYIDHFIWITGKFPKKLFLYDTDTGEKHISNHRAMYFMNHNYHGTRNDSDYWSWSLRVDGIFTDNFLESTRLNLFFDAQKS
jgi:hypothetical protein